MFIPEMHKAGERRTVRCSVRALFCSLCLKTLKPNPYPAIITRAVVCHALLTMRLLPTLAVASNERVWYQTAGTDIF